MAFPTSIPVTKAVFVLGDEIKGLKNDAVRLLDLENRGVLSVERVVNTAERFRAINTLINAAANVPGMAAEAAAQWGRNVNADYTTVRNNLLTVRQELGKLIILRDGKTVNAPVSNTGETTENFFTSLETAALKTALQALDNAIE